MQQAASLAGLCLIGASGGLSRRSLNMANTAWFNWPGSIVSGRPLTGDCGIFPSCPGPPVVCTDHGDLQHGRQRTA